MHETSLGPSGDGVVVMDIGGDVGALVLHAPAGLAGHEIDLTALDGSGSRTHSAVRERHHAGSVSHAAVYPALRAGRYGVEGSDQVVTIVGARVTEVEYGGAPHAVHRT